jgi:hypothetical protein
VGVGVAKADAASEVAEEGVAGGQSQTAPSRSPSPPLLLDPMVIDLSGFEFGVTMHQAMN